MNDTVWQEQQDGAQVATLRISDGHEFEVVRTPGWEQRFGHFLAAVWKLARERGDEDDTDTPAADTD